MFIFGMIFMYFICFFISCLEDMTFYWKGVESKHTIQWYFYKPVHWIYLFICWIAHFFKRDKIGSITLDEDGLMRDDEVSED